MRQQIIHHPRVAWDFARIAVTMAEADDEVYRWFRLRLGDIAGEDALAQLTGTRSRLRQSLRPDVRPVAAGQWRVWAEDLLGTHPDLAEDLQLLRQHAEARLTE